MIRRGLQWGFHGQNQSRGMKLYPENSIYLPATWMSQSFLGIQQFSIISALEAALVPIASIFSWRQFGSMVSRRLFSKSATIAL